jgi:hypothetical protein
MCDRPKGRCNKGNNLFLQTIDLTSEEDELSDSRDSSKYAWRVMSSGNTRDTVYVSAADKVEQQHMMGELDGA